MEDTVLADELSEDIENRQRELVETIEDKVESPCILVSGKVYEQLPEDLFIPPDALRVLLDAFAGPLDLLLYLIKKQNVDILDIPIVQITKQYISYIELMQEMKLELAADYLVMSATLAEIKSRLLLPRSTELEEDEEDPRAELIRRLQEYERIKIAAENLEEMPRLYRDTRLSKISIEATSQECIPDIALQELAIHFSNILQRADVKTHHMIKREVLSVRERMTMVLNMIDENNFLPYTAFFNEEEGRMGILVTFLAILELAKEQLIDLVQAECFGIIRVKAVSECQE